MRNLTCFREEFRVSPQRSVNPTPRPAESPKEASVPEPGSTQFGLAGPHDEPLWWVCPPDRRCRFGDFTGFVPCLQAVEYSLRVAEG